MKSDPIRPRGILRAALALSAVLLPVLAAHGQAAQQGSKQRAVTHDDYDSFPSLRSTAYSRDGRWMAFVVKPSRGDGVLHIREVDGVKSYRFERGETVTFSNDGKRAIFKIGKSTEEERRKKLEKLYEEKEEKKAAPEEEEEGLPPDIKKALVERGMTEAQALRMIEQQGVSLKEVRGFLGLPEPEKKKAKAPAKSAAKKAGESEEEKEAKALAKRVHILDLGTGEVTKVERVKGYRHPDDSDLLILHMEKPEPEKKKDDEKSEGAKKEGAKKKEEPAEGKAGETKPPVKEGKGEAGEKASAKKAAAETTPAAAPQEPKKSEPKKSEPKKSEVAAQEPKQEPKGKEEKEEKPEKDPLESKRRDGTRLVLHKLGDGSETVLEHVLGYGLVADDAWMWYTIGTKKTVEGVIHGLFARELGTGRTVTLLEGYSSTSGISTDREDTRMAFTSDLRTFAEEEKERDVYLWDFSDAPARRVVTAATNGVPEGYRIQSSGLGFSRDGSVLTLGVKPPKREDLPKILDEDKVVLDLWHWRDGYLQTVQAKRSNPAEATLTAVYHEDADKVVVLGTREAPRVSLVTPDGSRALASDSTPYEMQDQWDGSYRDYHLINTIDGSRIKIVEGLRGSASASPIGRYVTWFDPRDYHWHAYDVNSMQARNLTEGLGVAFDREQDDRPEPHGAHGLAGWTENDTEVLLNDEFDVWAVNPATGASRCVTDGLGRAANLTLRVTRTDLRPDAQRDDDEDSTWLKGTLVLRATDKKTYAQGYYTDSLAAVAKPRKLFMRDSSLGSMTRPKDADRLFVTFSRFDQYPDIWTTDLAFSKERKLTDVGKILDDYRWGSAELVQWRSDDGVELKGYLVKPDGFDPSRTYPMMVYFYERSSQSIHRFVTPSTGTSPNAAYYVSNGYLWFVPDIVYRDGYPGESCEKCVVSGVQHLISQGFVDKRAIGVAGHSWGGYQTAHLITRTDIFAAAESGAPVINMFSAYGGIRWGSGKSRQFQYEKTQSRIGGTIWEYPMRYWENSPLFHLDKVRTPVLILHNDKDGAVPWYQGIEFMVAMRRLGKEAYLANYNNEDHGLRKSQNKRDWTRRMQEFFDHHLKGAPAPEWMRHGVPYHDRMAEKIPYAPSYREALEAGLIKKEAANGGVPAGGGANGGQNQPR